MASSDPTRAPLPAADAAPVAWLAVEAGPHHCLLALGDTGEIFPWTVPQPVPHTLAWFLGVANLRGGLYGVARLDAFIAADADPQETHAPRRPVEAASAAPSRLIALHSRFEVNCALQVDRVLGLRGADLFEPLPGGEADAGPGETPAWRARGCVDASGLRWRVLDLQALARYPRFLSVGV